MFCAKNVLVFIFLLFALLTLKTTHVYSRDDSLNLVRGTSGGIPRRKETGEGGVGRAKGDTNTPNSFQKGSSLVGGAKGSSSIGSGSNGGVQTSINADSNIGSKSNVSNSGSDGEKRENLQIMPKAEVEVEFSKKEVIPVKKDKSKENTSKEDLYNMILSRYYKKDDDSCNLTEEEREKKNKKKKEDEKKQVSLFKKIKNIFMKSDEEEKPKTLMDYIRDKNSKILKLELERGKEKTKTNIFKNLFLATGFILLYVTLVPLSLYLYTSKKCRDAIMREYNRNTDRRIVPYDYDFSQDSPLSFVNIAGMKFKNAKHYFPTKKSDFFFTVGMRHGQPYAIIRL
ncbi:conserved Plasmodium protein, unknown function [Plasmodium ovale]|uniref:Uncharacterized protein n=2 Tax=Plasmodium ovale TaxID=36330 RepID=A0A1A8WU01_PLAOA|nr:hypothetical protein POVCU2_0099000 [Plasmodium ovale curtisi]SCA48743.1 conserved Plasmodium protein, unknown function [Plasmodium ovale]